MKTVRRLFLGVLLGCVLCAGAAHAAVGDYILKGGKAFRVDGGKETPLKDCEVQMADTEAGPWAWILIDPAQSDEMKGSKGGIYFFRGKENAPAGFLPVKEEAVSCRVTFSPSGEKLLVSWGMEYIRHLSLYFIDKGKGFVRKASFDAAGPPLWVDPHRFVLNAVNIGKGPRVKGRFDVWWSSVVLYDSVENERIVLKEATATEDYTVNGCDTEKGMLDVLENSVKDVKDWGDDAKVKDTELKLPIPAAG